MYFDNYFKPAQSHLPPKLEPPSVPLFHPPNLINFEPPLHNHRPYFNHRTSENHLVPSPSLNKNH